MCKYSARAGNLLSFQEHLMQLYKYRVFDHNKDKKQN